MQRTTTQETTIAELLVRANNLKIETGVLRARIDKIPTAQVLAMASIFAAARSRDYEIKEADFHHITVILDKLGVA